MRTEFKCFRIYNESGTVTGVLESQPLEPLTPGQVLIEAEYSSVNYKDALAATGRGKILRKFPLIGGIDVCGRVAESTSSNFHVGDRVVVTGCGLGETQNGGYAEYVRVPDSSAVPLPHGLTSEEAMIIGTAGFTAALCLYRMEQNGQTPQKGPIVVTGSSGGVGSLAVDILSRQKYEIWAVSGKKDSYKYLQELGARRVMDIEDLELGSRPLETVKFAGAIDSVGGALLANLLRHVDLWGNVACVGLAGGVELETTVMPFILRGVSLLGISSNNCPLPLRREIWKRLGGLWKPKHLKRIHNRTVSLEDLPSAFEDILSRRSQGRVLVAIRGS